MPLVAIDAPTAAAGVKPFDARGFVLAVDKDGRLFARGEAFASISDVKDWSLALDAKAKEAVAETGGSPRDAKWPVYVWADSKAPAGVVADVVTAIHTSGNFEPRLLVASKTEKPGERELPAAVAVIAKQEPTSEPAATRYVFDQVKAAMGECNPTILAVTQGLSVDLPAKQSDKLVTDLPASLVQCECKIPDQDVFEWGVQVWFGSTAPSLMWIDMPKMKKGDTKPIGALVK